MDPMTRELAFYVYAHYQHLFTPTERRANQRLAEIGGPYDAKLIVRADALAPEQWMSADPEVLPLVAGGVAAFQARVAQRILVAHRDEVILNHCPRCGELAANPRARWCGHCNHRWH